MCDAAICSLPVWCQKRSIAEPENNFVMLDDVAECHRFASHPTMGINCFFRLFSESEIFSYLGNAMYVTADVLRKLFLSARILIDCTVR